METAVSLPALLRAARGAYANAIRQELEEQGYGDLPRNGPYVLGGLASRGGPLAALIRDLGVTKQAASQLVDTLVIRGYLHRGVDPDDRRRMTVELTDRGIAAAKAVRTGVAVVDDQLAEMCTPDELDGLRSCLEALAEIKERLALD